MWAVRSSKNGSVLAGYAHLMRTVLTTHKLNVKLREYLLALQVVNVQQITKFTGVLPVLEQAILTQLN